MPAKERLSAWSPLKNKVFLVLWAAGLVSNIGTWIFNVASGWLMTDLTSSPLMVSLVQAATALPIFLFALPAGAFGDIFDRRKLLIVVQLFLACILFFFAFLLTRKVVNPWILLLFTFLTGTGTAFFTPVWQAVLPPLVTRAELPYAIALNGVSMNFARAIGPALGGIILAAFGATLAVVLDAVSYLFVVAALLWWQTKANKSALPRETLFGAMRAGLNYAFRNEALIATKCRAFFYVIFASVIWSLLPLIAKNLLHGGPKLYGLLLSGIGIGALIGAFLMPMVKTYLNSHRIVVAGTWLIVIALLLFAYGNKIVGLIASVMAGISWVLVLASLIVSAQLALPDWVRARGLAIFQIIFFGTMTLGSILWGHLAGIFGLQIILCTAAFLALCFIPLTKRWQLNLSENLDLAPSHHWADIANHETIEHHRGPVLVMIEYNIPKENRTLFEERSKAIGVIRKRDGAKYWGIFEDVTNEERYIEIFVDESWVAHLRKHERVTGADREVEATLRSLQRGETPLKITHAIAPAHRKK